MSLPTRATIDDYKNISKYLLNKPTGVSISEARKVLDEKLLDKRKILALKSWLLITTDNNKIKLTPEGRDARKDEEHLNSAFQTIIKRNEPYNAILEWAALREETVLTATDVAAHWHEHYPDEASDNDDVLNDQAICFFQVAEGAGLGKITLGRKGAPTRIELFLPKIDAFMKMADVDSSEETIEEIGDEEFSEEEIDSPTEEIVANRPDVTSLLRSKGRVFITHGKNEKIVTQLKEIVTFGKFIPIVAEEHETISKPVPDKVMDDMRSCFAGIIHVAGEQVFIDQSGQTQHKVNENVLIEIGAAMALYGRNFILLVEKGIQLPSNLQGLYECRYEGEKLDGEATMKLLKAFNEFV
jgi:predicted nucleotide-binding protein